MEYLVIYDESGKVVFSKNGASTDVLSTANIEVPEGKILVGIDTINGYAILEDIPKSENELLREDLENTRLALAELAEALLGGA